MIREICDGNQRGFPGSPTKVQFVDGNSIYYLLISVNHDSWMEGIITETGLEERRHSVIRLLRDLRYNVFDASRKNSC